MVVNIENTVRSIRRAVEEAEIMANCSIGSVYTGVAGAHIQGHNSSGVIVIKDREVTPAEVDRVIESARLMVSIPSDREVIHTLVQDFIIDGQDGIKDPVGIHGMRLECRIHIVTAAVTSALMFSMRSMPNMPMLMISRCISVPDSCRSLLSIESAPNVTLIGLFFSKLTNDKLANNVIINQ